MLRFYSQAQRVKYITHRQMQVQLHPDVIWLLKSQGNHLARGTAARANFVLNNLRTAYLSSANSGELHRLFGLSSKLNQLDLDLGFKAKRSSTDHPLCDFIQDAARFAPNLTRVNVRGLASPELTFNIVSLTKLQKLTLRIGASLPHNTFNRVTQLPLLSELELHAGHLNPHNLMGFVHANTFPSLQKLRLRTNTENIYHILDLLQKSTLLSLHLEIEGGVDTSTFWKQLFSLICDKSSESLEYLYLENEVDLSLLDPDSLTNNASTHSVRNLEISNSISFGSLECLSHLRQLRGLIIDMTFPLNILHTDIENMLVWWPNLEILDLGTSRTTDNGEQSPPSLGFASLIFISMNAYNLRALSLPLNLRSISPTTNDISPSRSPLEKLTFTFPFWHDPTNLAIQLHSLFPRLIDIDGPSELEEVLKDTRAALLRSRQQILG